jgi:hypothetical protein
LWEELLGGAFGGGQYLPVVGVLMSPKGPFIPNVRADQAAAAALRELTDGLFLRVVKAEAACRSGRAKDT